MQTQQTDSRVERAVSDGAAPARAVEDDSKELCFTATRFERVEGLSGRGRAALTKLMAGKVPEDPAWDASLMLGEALANAELYGSAPQVLCNIKVCARRVVMIVTYKTAWFDSDPPEPAFMALHGRGIRLIRAMAADGGGKAEWRFREAGSGRGTVVTVVMIKRF